MSLTQEQVKHIANLSRLELNNEELIMYSNNLNSIVEYIDMLNEVPNSSLESISESNISWMILRDDNAVTSWWASREELLNCSPKQKVNHSIAIGNIMS